jgi:hypothetical protein
VGCNATLSLWPRGLLEFSFQIGLGSTKHQSQNQSCLIDFISPMKKDFKIIGDGINIMRSNTGSCTINPINLAEIRILTLVLARLNMVKLILLGKGLRPEYLHLINISSPLLLVLIRKSSVVAVKKFLVLENSS